MHAGDCVQLRVHEAPTVACALGLPTVLGVPFAQGRLPTTGGLICTGPDGQLTPSAWRPLVTWPDGTVRWALVHWLARQAGVHELRTTPAAAVSSPAAPPQVQATRDRAGEQLQLTNGLVALNLSRAGASPVTDVCINQQPLLRAPDGLRLVVDDADTTHEPARRITLLECSPLRVRARVAGAHHRADGVRRLSYHLDVEMWAGIAAVRLDYQFFNLEPGPEFLPVKRLALDLDLQLEPATQRHFLQTYHGVFYEPRQVHNPAPVALVTDDSRHGVMVEDPAMLRDDYVYARWLDAPLINTDTWLGVGDGRRQVYLTMQDLAEMQPKRLASAGTQLSVEFWPTRAGTLDLQQGRSRRQVVTLTALDGAAPAPAAITAALRALCWEGRATLDPARLAQTNEFEHAGVLPHGEHARMESFLARCVTLDTPCDWWDLGDTPESGYQRSYTTLGLQRQPRQRNAPELPRVFVTSGQLAPWQMPHLYEPVWTNNEYDGIHSVATELLRTGQAGLWPLLRRMVRHNIEVDFFHYHDEKWLHRISPVHSARHSTSGGYPSHFWTQGLLEYYCLTGDPDVLEIANALGDAILRFFHDPQRGPMYTQFDREVGWALLALTCLWDITRRADLQAEIDRLLAFFTQYIPDPADPIASVIDQFYVSRLYFKLNILEGCDLYARRNHRPDLDAWLLAVLKPMRDAVARLLKAGQGAHSTPAAMAIAYERTGDKSYLQAGMAVLEQMMLDDPRWHTMLPEIKQTAVMHRAFSRFLGHAHRAGLLDVCELPSLRAPM